MTDRQLLEQVVFLLYLKGYTGNEMARVLKASRSTIYKIIKDQGR